MWEVIKFNKARQLVESRFNGLPYAQLTLINLLITSADFQTGVVSNITYYDLCRLLTIKPAPGRKGSGVPSKQSIRNYIKSIERECGDYFKVITEGQTLKFLFPELPKIFEKILKSREVNTEFNYDEILENIEQKEVLNSQVNTELNTEVNTHDFAKKLFINNKIKQ